MNQTWKVILAFTGIFAAGAVFGGFLTLRTVKQVTPAVALSRPERPPAGQFAVMVMKRLTQRLDLTESQQEQLRPIVEAADQEMRRLRRDNFRETLRVSDDMNTRVAAILTPEQQAKLEEMQRETRERWAQDRQRRWGEGPPNGEMRRERPRPPPDN